jgi:CheY-like chemotaxis protein
MNVLEVEQGVEERALLKKQLSLLGHEVTDCADAETALEIYQQAEFSLIIVALDLSGMNGLEFCHKIQAFPRRAKTFILVSTGRERPEEIQLALEAGANDYLVTPTSPSQLQVRLLVVEQQLKELTEYYQAREQIQHIGWHAEDLSHKIPPLSGSVEIELDAVNPDQEEQEAVEEPSEEEGFFTIKLEPTTLNNALEICEKYFLHDMLVANDWDKAKTADLLDIPLRILLRKMKKYDVFPRAFLQKH